jgi:Homeodomain-like domain
MPAKKYQVELTAVEYQSLEPMLRRGTQGARKLIRARILLKAAAGLSDEESAQEGDTWVPTIARTRKRFAPGRLAALEELPRPGRTRRLDERGEARLIAEACSPAPGGRGHWTLQLLADRAVESQLAVACSDDTVQRVLKKTRSSRG